MSTEPPKDESPEPGSPSGGTFTLTSGDVTTAPIPFTASLAEIADAMDDAFGMKDEAATKRAHEQALSHEELKRLTEKLRADRGWTDDLACEF